MDWKEWALIGLGTWYVKNKLDEKKERQAWKTDEDRWDELCQSAARSLQGCLAYQSKPSWYDGDSERQTRAFCQAVRERYQMDGNPLPETDFGEGLFDALSLSFAHAMELVNGNKAQQVRFAARYHAYMTEQKGILVYDEPSRCL